MLLSFNQWARGTAITARDKRDAMTVVVIHNEKSGRVGELQIPSHGGGRKGCSGERDKQRAAAAHICNPVNTRPDQKPDIWGLGQPTAFSTRLLVYVIVISVQQHGQCFRGTKELGPGRESSCFAGS
jgi:hypothetical protein